MPECQNCGSHVTTDYVRVVSHDGEAVHACPQCPDRVRVGGEIRGARAPRRTSDEGDVAGLRTPAATGEVSDD